MLVLLGLQLYWISRRSIITEERRTLERRTEERVRALVENSSDVITVVAPDLTVRWQSPSVARTLGLAVEDVVGRRVTSLVHPDDTRGLEKQLASVASSGGVATETVRFRHADGGWRHLEVVAESRLERSRDRGPRPQHAGHQLSARDLRTNCAGVRSTIR